MDCSDTALTVAKTLNSDNQFELNFDYDYGEEAPAKDDSSEKEKEAEKDKNAGSRRMLDEAG